jgi:hypothetical protein
MSIVVKLLIYFGMACVFFVEMIGISLGVIGFRAKNLSNNNTIQI